MCYHNAAKTGVCVVLERQKVDGLYACERTAYGRKRLVGVFFCIAVTWEVFRNGKHATVFQSFGISDSLTRHIDRVFSERAGADDRVVGVAVDVNCRGEVDMNAGFSAFTSHF